MVEVVAPPTGVRTARVSVVSVVEVVVTGRSWSSWTVVQAGMSRASAARQRKIGSFMNWSELGAYLVVVVVVVFFSTTAGAGAVVVVVRRTITRLATRRSPSFT